MPFLWSFAAAAAAVAAMAAGVAGADLGAGSKMAPMPSGFSAWTPGSASP